MVRVEDGAQVLRWVLRSWAVCRDDTSPQKSALLLLLLLLQCLLHIYITNESLGKSYVQHSKLHYGVRDMLTGALS